MIIGSHVSFGKNQLLDSVMEAISYNANTFMFYTGAPQNTLRKDIDLNLTNKAKELMLKNNIDIKFICFCIDDILFLHEIISQNVERFKGLYKYNFFRKTIERIGDMTDRLKLFLATPNEYSFDDVLKAEKIEISEKENLIKKEEELPHYKVNGPFAKNAKFFYLVYVHLFLYLL